MIRVLITMPLPEVATETLATIPNVTVTTATTAVDKANLSSCLQNYDAILCTVQNKFSADMFRPDMRVKVLSNYATGLDNIDLSSAKATGVAVFNVPDIVTNSTADHTFALLLTLCRQIILADKFVRDGKWTGWRPDLFVGDELSGKTLGIIGFGKIGQAVAKRAVAFGLRVLFFKKNAASEQVDDNICRAQSLEHLVSCSDYISVHLPSTEETRKLLNEHFFAHLSNSPFVVNTARGDLLNTEKLLHALSSGKIRGAALDVTDPEPLPGNHPLLALDNCFVTPHIGTATTKCRYEMARIAALNIVNFFRG